MTLRPLFFEVPINETDPLFIGRQWILNELENICNSSSPGIIISGEPGTGKTAIILQLVEYSCFGRKKELVYEQIRLESDLNQDIVEDFDTRSMYNLASRVIAYHFCQVYILVINIYFIQ